MFETLTPFGIFLFVVLLIWSFIWKGIALWKAVKNNHKTWYVVLLIINTVGILEIIYLFCCQRKKIEKEVKKVVKKKKR